MKLLFKLLSARSAIGLAVEAFFLNLSSPVNGTITDAQGVGTIQTNPIIPSVTLSRTSGKAPLAVGFDATATVSGYTTNPGHDLYYIWSFGDAAGETWSYGATVGLDKNAAYGPVAGHVFKTAGTFNWQLTIIDGRGNIGTSSGTVIASAWTAADTIYIANGSLPSAGGDVLAGATYYNETTWAGVASRFAANKRIMLKRGDTWACGATTTVPTGCEINSYGAGTFAFVTSAGATQTPFSLNSGQADVRVCNIKHTGPGPNVVNSQMVITTISPPSNLLLLGLESDGSTTGLLTAAPSINEVFVQDCYFHRYGDTGETTDTTNYAVYISHGYGVYLLGSSFFQSPSHLVRVAGGQRVVIDSCKFLKPSTGVNPRDALTIREIGDNTATWSGQYTEKVVVSNNDINTIGTSSTYTLHVGQTGSAIACRIRNVLIERNIVNSDYQPLFCAVRNQLTVRSNILTTQNDYQAMTWGCSNDVANDGGADDPRAFSDAQLYNNTIYKRGTNTFSALQIGSMTAGTSASGAIVRNNLVYAPNATTPTLFLAGTVSTSGTISSNNSSDAQMLSTRPWTLTTPVNPVDFTPVNYAVGGGYKDYRCQKDFFNATMNSPVEIGAINV